MELIYRKGSINDIENLKRLGIASYSEYSNVLTTENWNKLDGILNDKNNLKKTILNSTVFVCENKKDIVGAVYFFSNGNPTELYDSEWCYFRSLGVNPQYRGLGIGNKLTCMCIDYAREINEKTIALHTSEFMDTARKMYEKRGFKRIKEIQRLGKKYWIFTKQLKK
ncbi:GNAT family N-acetyltransferase [Tenacibaculum sp.]|nr:GNAT family N-acetyltransferase [Tenacibaculum sp.]